MVRADGSSKKDSTLHEKTPRWHKQSDQASVTNSWGGQPMTKEPPDEQQS